MMDETRKRISQLIVEELGEKIKRDENLQHKLEPFADLPVEKVADAIIKQFEYLLSSDLRDLIIHLIEQEIKAEESLAAIAVEKAETVSIPPPEIVEKTPSVTIEEEKPVEMLEDAQPASVMEHFGSKEHFPLEPMDIELRTTDWLYLYGFCYAPESTGKGVPSKKLALKGIDGVNTVFLMDYGDVRFFMNKISAEDYSLDKTGKPTLTTAKTAVCKYEHEKILNTLRAEEVMVSFPFWTIIQNLENIVKHIEDRYVELLRTLIDVHDAIEWDVEVFAFDQHIIELPLFTDIARERVPQRESRHHVSKVRNVKVLEKLLFKEKSFAQAIHSQLLLHSTKAKIDFMIRLDNAFMDDWKSILDARYTIGKEKRKYFCQTIRSLQKEYAEYELMFRVTHPNVRFTYLQ